MEGGRKRKRPRLALDEDVSDQNDSAVNDADEDSSLDEDEMESNQSSSGNGQTFKEEGLALPSPGGFPFSPPSTSVDFGAPLQTSGSMPGLASLGVNMSQTPGAAGYFDQGSGMGEWADSMMPHSVAETLTALAVSSDRNRAPRDQFNLAPNNQALPVHEKLRTGHYVQALHHFDAKLKTIRAHLSHRELQGLEEEMNALRATLEQYLDQFEQLKSNYFLSASDFHQLLKLEEYLMSTLSPQLTLYETDYRATQNRARSPAQGFSACLAVIQQESAGPIFKEHPLGPFTLKLLTGATITQIQSGPVSPELVDTNQRVKRNNPDIENMRQSFKENATAVFQDIKFASGTFPQLVRLKFRVTIQLVQDGQQIQKTIESAPTKPFVSMTNTGSQWKDAAGSWLKEDCFNESQEVSISRFWNYFQYHYLVATKQEVPNVKRPLLREDFDYMIHSKFAVTAMEKATMNLKEFQIFWNWIGACLKRIRYQKYLLWMFENGFLAAFITGADAVTQLKNELPGTFIIRVSERYDGEMVLSYVQKPGHVRHYMLQPDDTADKKKTLIDFLGQNNLFLTILQLRIAADGTRTWQSHEKDRVLQKYYKKTPRRTSVANTSESNPYDSRLPLHLDE